MAVNFATSVQLPEISELDGTNGFIVPGLNPGDWAGAVVTSIGDFNNDGFTDFLVTAPNQRDSEGVYGVGVAYVIFGRENGFPASVDLSSLSGDVGFTIEGLGNIDEFGISASGAGDINNDGFSDIIVGSRRGQTYVIYGHDDFVGDSLKIDDLNRNTGFNFEQNFTTVTELGDVNNDGIDDLAIGAKFFSEVAANSHEGAAFIIFGKNNLIGPSDVSLGTSANTIKGYTVADVAGSSGFILQRSDDSSTRFFGESISAAGDVNGDGLNDIIVSHQDAVHVFFGRDNGFPDIVTPADLDGTNGFTIEGDISKINFSGATVQSIGDFNGDGLDDIAIAAPNQGRGKVFVIFGSEDGFPASIDPTLLTSDQGFSINPTIDLGFDFGFGNAISGGDFNGDGLSDIVIGQSMARPDGMLNAGRVFIVFGTRDELPTNADLGNLIASNGTVLNGDEVNGYFGGSLDLTGDINGDGFDDLIIGKPSGRVDGGAVVFFGRSTDLEKASPVLPRQLVEDMALLYQAALDRQPDINGLNYFVGDLRQGQSLQDVANSFYLANEFRNQFTEFDNERYIDQLYRNVLDREADQDGFDYWLTDIEDRGRSHADVLVSFAQSQENRDNAAEWLSGLVFDGASDNWLL